MAGEDRNQLVVVGDGVDAVSLASILRKKVGPTDIIKVGEVPNKSGKNEKKGDGDEKKEKSKDSEKEEKKSGGKKDGKKDENGKHKEQQYQYNQNQYQHQNQYQYQVPKMEYMQEQQQWYPGYPAYQPVVVYDNQSYSNPNCSIM